MARKPKSASSSSSSSSATLTYFKPGAAVEISSEDDGFRGSWFTGRIVRRLAADRFLVEYDNLMEDEEGTKHLRESLKLHQLRPPPPTDTNREFKFGDEVDAFHNDGWWEGHINEELGNGWFAVYFRVSKEQINFSKDELRVHREWFNHEWIPPIEQQQQEQQENELKETLLTPNVKPVETGAEKKEEFSVGALVEVSSNDDGFRGAWFSATIVEARGKEKFLVEYQSLLADDDSSLLKEEVDILHMRPQPPQTGVVCQFNLLDEVDALYNDGWWVGVISKVLGSSRYIVYFRNNNEELEFEHSQLRLHQDWIVGKWVMASTALKL